MSEGWRALTPEERKKGSAEISKGAKEAREKLGVKQIFRGAPVSLIESGVLVLEADNLATIRQYYYESGWSFVIGFMRTIVAL